MARVVAADITAIMDIDASITDLTPFITMGNLFVDSALSGEGLSEALLTEIEKNVVAHLICARDPRAAEERAGQGGDISVKYMGKWGEGLKATPYGQNALLLDSTGKLARRGMKKASIGIVDYSVDL